MTGLQIVFTGAAILSSIFWALASLVHFPRLSWLSPMGHRELSDRLRHQSLLNAIAAAFAAVAALCQTALMFWPSF